jgi:hypothetical protein
MPWVCRVVQKLIAYQPPELKISPKRRGINTEPLINKAAQRLYNDTQQKYPDIQQQKPLNDRRQLRQPELHLRSVGLLLTVRPVIVPVVNTHKLSQNYCFIAASLIISEKVRFIQLENLK